MKILWVQDYNVFAFPGGAERNDRRIIHEGITRGHEITMDFEENFQLSIISNCVTIETKILDEILSKKPYIFFMHDYYFCRYRLFYPMVEKCKICSYKNIWEKRFLKSNLLIFLSPLHRNVHYFCMPGIKEIKTALIPSTLDPDKFYSKEQKIKDSVLVVNGLLPYKGGRKVMQFIERHQNFKYTIISPNPENYQFPACVDYIGERIPNHELLNLFAEAEFYLELPETPQPFNRTFIESKLSGCKIITNKLAGALSYDWFNDTEKMKIELKKAPVRFWEEVEKCLT